MKESQFPLHPQTEPYKTLQVKRLNIKSVSMCHEDSLALLVTFDELVILDTDYNQIIKRIKRLSNIRTACFSLSGRLILAYLCDNTLRLIDVKSGKDVGQLLGVPNSPKMFVFSDRANRVIGGDNQTLGLWQVANSNLEIYSKQWRNLNCYALNNDGSYFALGTFNGQIYILGVLGENKCSQIEYNKHEKCVMIMAWSGNTLLSVSFDHILLIFQFNDNPETPREKVISFKWFSLGFLPREIKVIDDVYFFSGTKGIYWFTTAKLIGFADDNWNVSKSPIGEIQMVRYRAGQLAFWKMVPKDETQRGRVLEISYNH